MCQVEDTSLAGRIERMLRSWPITPRDAVFLVVVFSGSAALAAALGLIGQLLQLAVGHRMRRRRRRNV